MPAKILFRLWSPKLSLHSIKLCSIIEAHPFHGAPLQLKVRSKELLMAFLQRLNHCLNTNTKMSVLKEWYRVVIRSLHLLIIKVIVVFGFWWFPWTILFVDAVTAQQTSLFFKKTKTLFWRKRKVWRKKETAYDLMDTTSCVKHGGGNVMARAWMAASGTEPLVLIDDVTADRSRRLNSGACRALFSAPIQPNAAKLAVRCLRSTYCDSNTIVSQFREFNGKVTHLI